MWICLSAMLPAVKWLLVNVVFLMDRQQQSFQSFNRKEIRVNGRNLSAYAWEGFPVFL